MNLILPASSANVPRSASILVKGGPISYEARPSGLFQARGEAVQCWEEARLPYPETETNVSRPAFIPVEVWGVRPHSGLHRSFLNNPEADNP